LDRPASFLVKRQVGTDDGKSHVSGNPFEARKYKKEGAAVIEIPLSPERTVRVGRVVFVPEMGFMGNDLEFLGVWRALAPWRPGPMACCGAGEGEAVGLTPCDGPAVELDAGEAAAVNGPRVDADLVGFDKRVPEGRMAEDDRPAEVHL
jgi:hypothetical protein